jgi:tRNA(adenine34) deaminase
MEEVAPAEPAARDRHFMRLALEQARLAYSLAEVPVGCVIVAQDGASPGGSERQASPGGSERQAVVVARAHNRREIDADPTAHAEMRAIVAAAAALESWRLDGATLYVTLEPCAMCAGAIVLARVGRLVYGARDPRAGACGSLYDIPRDARLNHRPEVTEGVLADEAGEMLRSFFRARREGTLGKP